MSWGDWPKHLWDGLSGKVGDALGAAIAAAVITLVGIFIVWLIKRGRWLIDYHQRLSRVRRDVGREDKRPWRREGKGLWLAQPIYPPEIRLAPGYSPKVLVVANAKGGVGKTTLAANIAARLSELALASGEKPILLIDIDFQGTLSAMSIYGDNAWLPEKDRDSEATYLVSGDLTSEQVANVQKAATYIRLRQNQNNTDVLMQNTLRLITSYYDLAQTESRVMVEWLIGNRKSDARFYLRKVLWSEAVALSFSVVIVDCPPRFTTAAIQAFAAATHILIPTKLDYASREAVDSFIGQIEVLRAAEICWDRVEYVGVVATMVDPRANVEDLRTQLNDKVKGRTRCLGAHTDIHENVIFRDAGGRGIAYFLMGDSPSVAGVKKAVQLLSQQVARAMNLPHTLQKEPENEGNSAERVVV